MNCKLRINIIVAFLLLMAAQLCNGQSLDFDIHKNRLPHFLAFEKSTGGVEISNRPSYGSGDENASVITFIKHQEIIPDLITEYGYYEDDSTLAYVFYEWDVFNFNRQDNNRQTSEFQNGLIAKYNQLEEQLTEKFGKGISEGDLPITNSENGLQRKDIWHADDGIEIEMYIVISNFYQRNDNIVTNPTHRIRLLIRKMSERN